MAGIENLTVESLTKNIIALGIIACTLTAYMARVFDPSVAVPPELQVASVAVLGVYGFQIAVATKAALAKLKPPESKTTGRCSCGCC